MRRPLAAAIALVTSVLAAAAGADGLKEVEDCVRRNIPTDTSVQTIALKVHDATGGTRDMRGTIWWKKGTDGFSRARMLFAEPADLRGAGMLLIEKADRNDMFVYLPELKRVRRISGQMASGSLFGTDITYEQIERLQGVAKDTDVERLPDTKLDGHDVYALQSKPATNELSEFSRILAYIDKTTCVPLKIEFYGGGTEPRRVVTADPAKISKQGKGYLPSYVLARDLQSSTQTELVVEKIEVGRNVQDKHFTETALVAEGS